MCIQWDLQTYVGRDVRLAWANREGIVFKSHQNAGEDINEYIDTQDFILRSRMGIL